MGFNRALKFNYRIGRRNKIEVYTRTNFKNGRCEVNYRRNWRRIAILTTIIDVKDKIWRRFLYLYKLTFITLNSVFGIFIKNKNIKFFLTIDTEAKFIDKVAVDIDSYEKDIYESCIKIADLANEYDIKVIFFVDYPEIDIFRKHQKRFDDLIYTLSKAGHSIQLHIHPALINDESSPDISFYSFSRIQEMIADGCNKIENITGKRPYAFRAGGYSVGEWAKIYSALIHAGIRVDSSTFSGAKNLHNALFDFSNLENMKPYYPSERSLIERAKSGLIEFPITTVTRCVNNLEASKFRFDPSNSLFSLKIFTNYLLYKYDDIYINMIYHSKQVFNEDGSHSTSFNNLCLFLKFLTKKNFKSCNLKSVIENI